LNASAGFKNESRIKSPTTGLFSRLAPPLLWMTAIIAVPIVLSPPLPDPTGPRPLLAELVRSVIHITEYGILGLLLLRAGSKTKGSVSLFRIWEWEPAWKPAAFVGILFAVADEVQQGFLPNRNPSLLDIAADLAGIALAVLAVRFFIRKRGTFRPQTDSGVDEPRPI